MISLISKGEKRENIIAGIHESIGARVVAMAKRVGIVEPVMMTGGVAKNAGVLSTLEKLLNRRIRKARKADPQLAGAIGAALLAGYLPARRATRVDPLATLKVE